MRSLFVAALLLAAVCGAACASTNTPGGLSREETPQFVLLSHDDAIKGPTYGMMTGLTAGKVANNCPIAATMFLLDKGNSCSKAKDLYNQGYELAVHAITHDSFLPKSKDEIAEQIVGGRQQMADCIGISAGEMMGARAPFLEIKPEVWEVLSENGFLYDSSLIENTKGKSISNGMGDRVWPWDLGEGFPQNCDLYQSSQKCSGSYPGLKEVPLWDLSAYGGTFTMDYGDDPYGGGGSNGNVLGTLMANFEESYNGNRAPFPLFIHSEYLEGNKGDVEAFIDEVSQREGVYFITIRQLLAWMSNPIPLQQLTPEALGCGNPGGAPGTGEPAEPILDEFPAEVDTPPEDEEEGGDAEDEPEEEASQEEDAEIEGEIEGEEEVLDEEVDEEVAEEEIVVDEEQPEEEEEIEEVLEEEPVEEDGEGDDEGEGEEVVVMTRRMLRA
ncbi:hypothetical protein CHLNCDRAFT_138796 [Chlorella variabilis]|uniref:NodB homology domain-containing protein n=1 Tax=Chlorella variabilis TaxID=554065 RepID=E1ZNS2_CHLVA|nr:hypothetical protein CHLNCDRAFT_138796 [Chlorella variabilis]EFN52367.1 hypothetical protein CHLNCDRAFT_138796 [Chlorella variabilis]|eukprot:XP_005844469.1 hypothetical protein CHLNCDRAFT_138796 [Chlorella variabilis]